jgi:hypothetical protein
MLAFACTSAESPVSSPAPEVAAPGDPVPGPDEPESWIRGRITGRFVVPRQVVRVAEPVMVEFEVRSEDGPLVVFVGGDQRNAAYFPTRVGVKATRVDDGAVVCDSVASPAIPSFGGPGADRTLVQDEVLRESFVLNPMCPALAEPGTYRMELHRRLTHSGMRTKKPDEPTLVSCDIHPVHMHSELVGVPQACVEMMENAPSVTTKFEVTVRPYDREAVEAAISAAYARASSTTPKDEIAKARLEAWLHGWVKCDGKELTDEAPKTLAGGCARPVVR